MAGDVQKVRAEDLDPKVKISSRPSWEQLNASRFAWFILGGMLGVTVILSVVLLWAIPPLKELLARDDGIEIYMRLRDSAFDRVGIMFKDVVAGTMMPILTLLFGYAFAAQKRPEA